MREMHPIDEQFKSLYDAEATPPEEVRAAIGHRLGWNKTTGSGMSYTNVLLLVIGLSGATFALYNWNSEPSTLEASISVLTESTAPNSLSNGENSLESKDLLVHSTSASASDPSDLKAASVGAILPVVEAPENELSNNDHADRSLATQHAVDRSHVEDVNADRNVIKGPVNTTHSSTLGSAPTSVDRPGSVDGTSSIASSADAVFAINNDGATSDAKTGSSMGATSPPNILPSNAATSAIDQWVAPVFQLEKMDLLARMPESDLGQKQLGTAKAHDQYVLPQGDWWVSIYGGASSVQGKWKGADAEALDRSEKWKSGWQAGAMVGREWRSGLSVGGGVGIARIHSTFSFDQRAASEEVADTDTTWTSMPYPPSQIMISTWSIDTTYTSIEGPINRTLANNQYTAIQIPLSLWWHTDLRRWRLGASAGVMGWVPMQRKGTTLLRSTTDSEPVPTDVSSNATNGRFGMQLHGTAGLSIGFRLNEQVGLLAEPMLSAPLYVGNEKTNLSLTRPTLQFRIQYDLPTGARKAK